MANEFQLSEEQKAKIEPHLKAAVKSIFLAGIELGKAVAQNSENKLDDVLVPVVAQPLEQIVDGLIAKISI